MGEFLDELGQTTSVTQTQNGDKALSTTNDAVLDFFSRAGAMRSDLTGAVKLFKKAYAENPELAVKALFYLRDIRGGQGERTLFIQAFRSLVDDDINNNTHVAEKLLPFISEYGRWDELLQVITPYNKDVAIKLIRKQLDYDIDAMADGDRVSLLAKWLPSENTSSTQTRSLARFLMAELDMKPAAYRKMLSQLRKHIALLEHKMSTNEWSAIEYDKIPSQAGRKHTKAFRRHDEDRYSKYLEDVMSGEKKMNASALYTYEVYDMINDYRGDKKAADAMWKSLPDWTNGSNAMVMADVSDSMMGRPMSVSVSLALYFAERNKGAFQDYFMTFSSSPKLVKIQGKTLSEKMRNIERADWAMSTDLRAAFQAILTAAKNANAKQDEIPAVLYIISDMQFNAGVNADQSTFENAKALFEANGYELPHVVFWNVNSYDNSPVSKFQKNVSLISGSSQSAFALAVQGKTPLETMLDVLGSDRYAQIVL